MADYLISKVNAMFMKAFGAGFTSEELRGMTKLDNNTYWLYYYGMAYTATISARGGIIVGRARG